MMDSDQHQASPWLMAFAAAPVTTTTTTGSMNLIQTDLFVLYLTIATSVIIGVLAGFSWRGAKIFHLLGGARSPALFGFHRLCTILLSMALAVPALRGAWDLMRRFSALRERRSSSPLRSGYGGGGSSAHSRGAGAGPSSAGHVAAASRQRLMTLRSGGSTNQEHAEEQGEEGGGEFPAQRRDGAAALSPLTRANLVSTGCSSSSSSSSNPSHPFLDDEDLRNFQRMLEDEDPAWEPIISKSTSMLTFSAWRREVLPGPTQYRSSTIFEGCTPELIANFFWDDDFRCHWDDMLVSHRRLEGLARDGAEIVHWTRRFPFFCSPRDYVISRRIWCSAGKTFYCITKGIDHPGAPRQAKPRRVDVYSSSWLIRAVPSAQGNAGPAAEVKLFHHEEMGIQRDLAKFGVRKGMWGCVKKMEPGVQHFDEVVRSQPPQDRKRIICTRLEDGRTVAVGPLDGVEGGGASMSNEAGEDDDGGGGGAGIAEQVLGGLEALGQRGLRRTVVKKGMKMALIAGGVVLACGVNHATVYKLVGMGLVKALMRKRIEKQGGIMTGGVGL